VRSLLPHPFHLQALISVCFRSNAILDAIATATNTTDDTESVNDGVPDGSVPPPSAGDEDEALDLTIEVPERLIARVMRLEEALYGDSELFHLL
jgi:hypothetical protein